MSSKIYISGGGNAKDTYELDHVFFNLSGNDRILYIPIGLKRDIIGFDGCYEWFLDVLSMHTKKNPKVEMWINLKGKNHENLHKFDAIYIGGASNTYQLLEEINNLGFIYRLLDFVKNGGNLYGGSSGAIILGKNIGTVEDENDNNYKYQNGLNLVGGYSILCHYDNLCDKKILSYLQKYKNPVIALPKDIGLLVCDNEAKVCGYDKCYVFETDGKINIFRHKEIIQFNHSVIN